MFSSKPGQINNNQTPANNPFLETNQVKYIQSIYYFNTNILLDEWLGKPWYCASSLIMAVNISEEELNVYLTTN